MTNEKIMLIDFAANMLQNFKGHSLDVHFKQVFWKSRKMKWSPYIISKNVSQRLLLVDAQKVALEFYKIDKKPTLMWQILFPIFLLGTYPLMLKE